MASIPKEEDFLCNMIYKGANGSILSTFAFNANGVHVLKTLLKVFPIAKT
jgi:hypothetical protein